MKEIISTITRKGQVTIPVEVRKYLGLKAHDKIAFVLDEQGGVQLKAPNYPTVSSLRGAAGTLEKPLSWEKMRQIAYEDRFASILFYSYDRDFDRISGIRRQEPKKQDTPQ